MEGNEEEIYGAGFPLLDRLKLLAEWAPLLAQLQIIGSAQSPHEQAVAIVKTLQWAAGKSTTSLDDETLRHVEAVLRTKEGKEAFDWAYAKIAGGIE
ncbi:MAG: hypothetical protein ACO38P_08560 [Phycisphaerales bacterium]